MKSTLFTTAAAAALAGTALLLTASDAESQATPAMATFDVTITNLTRGQIFSPPVLATHAPSAAIFQPGAPASMELQLLAEDGDNGPLAALLGGAADVFDVQAAGAPIMPGSSATFTITADTTNPLFSMAGMLISTNDAFVGLDGVRLPLRGERFLAEAYDAGTEFNSEDCAFIPGPPCGAGAVHDPAPAEGYIYISNGVQGIGNVPKETYDWRSGVALVEIERQ